VQVEIRDPLTHAPLPDVEVGEIALRTAASCVGYWRNPEATTGAFDADRWYHTGDHGHIREGFVYLEGRRHDLIIRGGEHLGHADGESDIIQE
jgi:fatty-acyl-CoA synthase